MCWARLLTLLAQHWLMWLRYTELDFAGKLYCVNIYNLFYFCMCVSVCVKIYPDAMQCKFSDEFRHRHVLQVLCVHLDKIWCWNNATICSMCPFGFMCFTCCSDKSVAAAQDLFPLVHSSANLQQNQEHFLLSVHNKTEGSVSCCPGESLRGKVQWVPKAVPLGATCLHGKFNSKCCWQLPLYSK